MNLKKVVRTWIHVIRVALLAFFVFLIGFEGVPSSSVKDTHYIVVAGFQRAQSQVIERSAYALLYSPASQKAQAMSDLKSTLSAFQQEQTLLWTNPDPEVQNLLQQAQPNYLSIVAAAQALIASPHDQANLLDLDIILSYDRSFFSTMDALVTVLQQQEEERNSQLLFIKVAIGCICGLMTISLAFFDQYGYTQSTTKQNKNTE